MFDKPIVFIDIETTGLDIYNDRIVQIATHKVFPDGNTESKCHLINPLKAISKESMDIHKITNEMVLDKPTFNRIANNFHKYIEDSIIVTYNGDNFDLPMLAEEFYRNGGIMFPTPETVVIDVIKLERKLNSHSLSDAYKRYTGNDLENAHDALHDCIATEKVLEGQIGRYSLTHRVDDILELLKPDKEYLEIKRQIYKKDGVIYWNFGKNSHKPILDDINYVKWYLEKDFPIHSKLIIKELLKEKMLL